MAQRPPVSAAVKLLTGQLAFVTVADKKFKTSNGIEFQRAWIQGFVVSVDPDGSSFEMTDKTGPPLTVCCRAGERVPMPMEYVLVVGKLNLRRSAKKDDTGGRSQEEDPDSKSRDSKGKRRKEWHLAAQKVRSFTDGDRRADLWLQEVRFMHQALYPKVAQHGGGG